MAVSVIDSSYAVYDDETPYPHSSTTASSTYVIQTPTSGGPLQAGDLLIFQLALNVSSMSSVSIAAPNGSQALIGYTSTPSAANYVGGAVYYKFITSDEATAQPSSWSFELGEALYGSAVAVRFRGVDSEDPVAVSSPSVGYSMVNTTSTGVTRTAPAVTTDTADAMVIGGNIHRSGSNSLTIDTSGWTIQANTSNLGGRSTILASRNSLQTSPGSTGSVTFRTSGSGRGWAYQTALKPGSYVEEPTEDVPVATFTADVTAGDAPLTVQFTDESLNSPTAWSWDFGDGDTSTSQHPTHVYDEPGLYDVTLTATNVDGSDIETKTDYISVSDPSTGSNDLQVVRVISASSGSSPSFLDIDNVLVSGSDRYLLVGAGINHDEFEYVTSVVLDPGGSNQTTLSQITFGEIEDDGRVEMWGAVNPPEGMYTVRVTLNTSLLENEIICAAWVLSGVNQTTPTRGSAGNGGVGTSISATVATQADDLVIGQTYVEAAAELGYSISTNTPASTDWSVSETNDVSVGAQLLATSSPTTSLSWDLSVADKWAAAAVSFIPVGSVSTEEPGIEFALIGSVTDSRAQIRMRLSGASAPELKVSTSTNLTSPISAGGTLMADNVWGFDFSNLSADTVYHYGFGSTKYGQFKTFPSAGSPSNFVIAAASCNQTSSNASTFERIRDRSPALFFHMGDWGYPDIETNNIGLYRNNYKNNLNQSRQKSMFANTPMTYSWDDHDFGPNNAVGSHPGKPSAQQAYREYVPHYELPADTRGGGNGEIYHSFTIGRVRFVVLDCKSERSAEDATDNSSKTTLGSDQKQWLKDTLLAASEPIIVLGVAEPWIASSGGDPDGWGMYSTERAELSKFFDDNSLTERMILLHGDAHMLGADDGGNTNYNPGATSDGPPLFNFAPLDRTNSVKGGPYSEGTYTGSQNQYGTLEFQDNGDNIVVTGSGWQVNGESESNVLTMQMVFAAESVDFPIANFTSDVTSGSAPLAVQFTDTSTNSPTSWLWDFGDEATSTDQNPAHSYTTPGTYNVQLTVENTDGSDSVSKANYITVSDPGGEAQMQVFSSSGTFVVPEGVDTVDVLVVGGGGAGGTAGSTGGGGGAGGVRQVTDIPVSGSVAVTVGQGGTGGTSTAVGESGQSSSFGSETALGGGGGGAGGSINGANGGSGGGGAGASSSASLPGNGTAGQGHAGGDGNPQFGSDRRAAGGGGGAGAIGQDAYDGGEWVYAGSGGAGVNMSSTVGTDLGVNGWFGGGGGGALFEVAALSYSPGAGGTGGGGAGAIGATAGAENGIDGTGGGGGGARSNATAGDGGDGIVIVMWGSSPPTGEINPAIISGTDTSWLREPGGTNTERWTKPVGRLAWWTGDRWDAALPRSSGVGHAIHQDLLGSTTVGATYDSRNTIRSTVVWDSGNLWVLRAHSTSTLINHYSYSDGTYTAQLTDASVPLTTSNHDSSPIVLRRSSDGALWAATVSGSAARVTRSTDGGSSWETPQTILSTTAATGMAVLECVGSQMVLFVTENDVGSVHVRTIPYASASISAGQWSSESFPSLGSTAVADDHASSAVYGSNMYVAAKTTNPNSTDPIIYLAHRAKNGSWSIHTIEEGIEDSGSASSPTRPSVATDGVNVWVFYSTNNLPHDVRYRQALVSDLQSWSSRITLFDDGRFRDGALTPAVVPNATSGLLLIAHEADDRTLWQAWLSAQNGPVRTINITVWDGTQRLAASVRGVWDGTQLNSANIKDIVE